MFFIFIGCAAVCGYAPNDYAPSRILGACRVQSVIVSIILGRGNVTKHTVSSWEQEKSEPYHEMLIKICKLYAVSSDYLLGISNVDPAYVKKRPELFSAEDQALMKEFESFLRWRGQIRKGNPGINE